MAVNHNGNGRLSAKEPPTNKQPKQHINKMKFNKDYRPPPTNHNQNCQIKYNSNGFLLKNEMNESQQQLVLSDLLFENTMASMVNGQKILAAPSNIFSYPSPSSLSSSSSSLSSSSSSSSSSSPSSFLNSKKDYESPPPPPPSDTCLLKEVDLKNNIDFAIDAVIDRCRQEQDQDNEETTTSIKNESQTNNEANASSSMSRQNVDLPPPSSPSSINHPSVNMDISDSCVAGSTIVQQHQQQQQPPMSKSSKARTSYISSLIANREKTSKDEEKKQIDDKQKRISQNILSILATVNTTNNTNISPKKEPLLPPLPHTSTHTNTPSTTTTTTTSKSKQPVTSSPKSKSITKEIQPLPAASKTAASLNELITMINNTTTTTTAPSKTNLNEKSFSLLEKAAPNVANKEAPPIDFFINTSNAQITKCEQTSQQEQTVNLFVNNSFKSNNTITSEQSHSFLDCVNLKMLLSQPIEKRPVVGDDVATSGGCESQLDQRILDTSFDSKLIRIEITQHLNDKKKQQLENGNVITKKIVKKKRKTTPLDQASLSDIASTIESVALAVADKNFESSSPPQNQQQFVEKKRKLNIIKRKATKREEDPKILPLKQEPPKPVDMTMLVERCVEKLPTFKAKKLKTIADIVKHNSTQQFNTAVNQRLLQQQSSVSSSNSNHDSLASSCSSSNSSSSSLSNFINSNLLQDFTNSNNNNNNNNNTNNLTVSWINNTLANNSLFSSLDNFYASENVNGNLIRTNNNNMDAEINIDHLLEIELTANQQSPIDKYIDLDEIDVNPIEDCYRNTSHINNNTNNSTSTTNANTNSNNGVLQNTNNTNLDEFALQFSVCSSSSSGFSEPSSFSCSSSMSSTNSGMSRIKNLFKML